MTMDDNLIRYPLSRRALLGQAGMAGLALAATPAWAQSAVDLGLPARRFANRSLTNELRRGDEGSQRDQAVR